MIYYNRGYYFSSLINSDSVFACFGTKETGDGKDKQSSQSLLTNEGITYKRIVSPIQTHSTTIVDTDIEESDQPQATDGLIATKPQIALTIMTADCVPVLFNNGKSGRIGISHQGWRGLMSEMPMKMIKEMGAAGDIRAAIGPAIGMCCYEVTKELFDQFVEKFKRYDGSFVQIRNDKYYLNLNRLCYLQLAEAGVSKKHSDTFISCTKCNERKFFSYRRDGADDKRRLFSMIIKKH